MSNVVSLFADQELFETITYRNNTWKLNSHRHTCKGLDGSSVHGYHTPDFRIDGNHDRGSEPFTDVDFTVFVAGRQSNETFNLNRTDVVAIRDMFASIAQTMCDEPEEC